MIMFPMLLLILVPLAAGIESLFVKKENVWGVSVLAGFCIGAFAHEAVTWWAGVPVVSIVLLILAAALAIRMVILGTELLTKWLLTAAATIVVLFVLWQGLLVGFANMEVVSDVETVNPEGAAGTALVVYHPGRSGFQETLNRAFAEGLASNGWRVDVTTASKGSPTDLAGYDLLVFGSPTYEWKPSRPIRRYLEDLGDLGGQATVAIISGAGFTHVSLPTMEALVREANGDLVKSMALWTFAPNEMYGTSDVEEIMRRAANEIPLPGKQE